MTLDWTEYTALDSWRDAVDDIELAKAETTYSRKRRRLFLLARPKLGCRLRLMRRIRAIRAIQRARLPGYGGFS